MIAVTPLKKVEKPSFTSFVMDADLMDEEGDVMKVAEWCKTEAASILAKWDLTIDDTYIFTHMEAKTPLNRSAAPTTFPNLDRQLLPALSFNIILYFLRSMQRIYILCPRMHHSQDCS